MMGCPLWSGGTGLTHSGSGDEIWELLLAAVQNGLLDPFHVQEQSGIHGCRWTEVSAQAEIISLEEGT